MWTTTCVTTEPTDESAPKYADWEGSCILHTSIDVLTHGDGIRHSGFEGQMLETTRGLLVIVACALRRLQKTRMGVSNLDPGLIEDMADAFSFCEIRKKSLHVRFCTVLRGCVSDKVLLTNCGGIVLPMAMMRLYLTFARTAVDTVRTSLPKEIRLALKSHKNLFYSGGLVLSVASSISAPPAYIFHIALLTLLSLEQTDQVPTRAERPRGVSDFDAKVAPIGHAPWLQRVLSSFKEDTTEGSRPLPWITPSLLEGDNAMTWSSSGNTRSIKSNKTPTFCPGTISDGVPQPYVVGTGAINSPVCQSIVISIANPRVYHSALHSGSDSNKKFVLHIFPKSVLR
jgi:hypothetical protein